MYYPPNFSGQGMMQSNVDYTLGTYSGSMYPYIGFGGAGYRDYFLGWSTHHKNLVALQKEKSQRSYLENFTGRGVPGHFTTANNMLRTYTQSLERARDFQQDRLDNIYGGSATGFGRNVASSIFLEGAYDEVFGGFDRQRRERVRASTQLGSLLESTFKSSDLKDARFGVGIANQYASQKRLAEYLTNSEALSNRLNYSVEEKSRLKDRYGWKEGILGQYQTGLLTSNERVQLANFMGNSAQMRGVGAIYTSDSKGNRVLADPDSMSPEEKKRKIELAIAKRTVEAEAGMAELAKEFNIEDKQKLTDMSYTLSEGRMYALNKGDFIKKVKDIVNAVGGTLEDYVEVLKTADEMSGRLGLSISQGRSVILSGSRTASAYRESGVIRDETVKNMGGELAFNNIANEINMRMGATPSGRLLSLYYDALDKAKTPEDREFMRNKIKIAEQYSGAESEVALREAASEILKKFYNITSDTSNVDRLLELEGIKAPENVDISDKIIRGVSEKGAKEYSNDPKRALDITKERLKLLGIEVEQLGVNFDRYLYDLIKEIKVANKVVKSLDSKEVSRTLSKEADRISREYEDSGDFTIEEQESRSKSKYKEISRAVEDFNKRYKLDLTEKEFSKFVHSDETKREDLITKYTQRAVSRQREEKRVESSESDFEFVLPSIATPELKNRVKEAFKNEATSVSEKRNQLAIKTFVSTYNNSVKGENETEEEFKKRRAFVTKLRVYGVLADDPETAEAYSEELKALKEQISNPEVGISTFLDEATDLDRFSDSGETHWKARTEGEEFSKLTPNEAAKKRELNKTAIKMKTLERAFVHRANEKPSESWADSTINFFEGIKDTFGISPDYVKSPLEKFTDDYETTFGKFDSEESAERFKEVIKTPFEKKDTAEVMKKVGAFNAEREILRLRTAKNATISQEERIQKLQGYFDSQGMELKAEDYSDLLNPFDTMMNAAEKEFFVRTSDKFGKEKESIGPVSYDLRKKYGKEFDKVSMHNMPWEIGAIDAQRKYREESGEVAKIMGRLLSDLEKLSKATEKLGNEMGKTGDKVKKGKATGGAK